MSDYQPGTYTKGEQTRLAETPADAVALVFDGFVRNDEVSADEPEGDAGDDNPPVEVTSDLGKGDGSASSDADPGPSGGAASSFLA